MRRFFGGKHSQSRPVYLSLSFSQLAGTTQRVAPHIIEMGHLRLHNAIRIANCPIAYFINQGELYSSRILRINPLHVTTEAGYDMEGPRKCIRPTVAE